MPKRSRVAGGFDTEGGGGGGEVVVRVYGSNVGVGVDSLTFGPESGSGFRD